MTRIKETVGKLRAAHLEQPTWVDPDLLNQSAALIELLAKALDTLAKGYIELPTQELEAIAYDGEHNNAVTDEEAAALLFARRELAGKE